MTRKPTRRMQWTVECLEGRTSLSSIVGSSWAGSAAIRPAAAPFGNPDDFRATAGQPGEIVGPDDRGGITSAAGTAVASRAIVIYW